MELYNLFTKPIKESDKEVMSNLLYAKKELDEVIGTYGTFLLVSRIRKDKKVKYWSIIGQVYGDDTNVGDLDVLWILSDIEHTWFDSEYPTINNMKL